MTSKKSRQWVVKMLLATGVILALVAAAPEAEASFRLSVGTGGFYFAVGHHDYFPYYGMQSPSGGGYGATEFSFRNTLNDYGYWQYSPELGMEVWIPYVEYGWRPYTYGHWTYSPYGWTWVSYEPWGWIPHHYGNWTYVDQYGWAWVPGYTWRPHCVNFALVNGYIGWAPVAPPWYRYSYNRDYRYHGDRGYYSGWHHGNRNQEYSGIDYSAYVFVDNRNFYGTGIYEHALLPGRGAEMFRAGQVMPLGDDLQLDYVKRVTGRPITPVTLDRQVYKVNGSEVVHYQPRGQNDLVRQAALPTVNRALAPGFQNHGVSFKGSAAQSAGKVNSLFKQEAKAPRTTAFTQAAVSPGMAGDEYYQKQKRTLDDLSRTRASKSGASAAGPSRTGKASSATSSRSSSAGSGKGQAVSRGSAPLGKGQAVSRGSAPSGKGQAVSRGSAPSGRGQAVSRGSAPSGKGQAVSRGSAPSGRGQAVSRGSAPSGKGQAVSRGSAPSGRGQAVSRGSAPSGKGQAVSRGSAPSGRGQAVSRGSAPSGKGQAVSRGSAPSGKGQAVSRGSAPSGKGQAVSRGKPPASTRTVSRPPQGKPSKPAGSPRPGTGASGGKSSGKPAGEPAGKPSSGSSKGKDKDKGKSGKRN
jgi:hypothetical protein